MTPDILLRAETDLRFRFSSKTNYLGEIGIKDRSDSAQLEPGARCKFEQQRY